MADAPYVHPNGICESSTVGEGTRIWAFAHVLPDARIGRFCNICDGVFVENDVVVGDRVTLKCGVQLWDGLRVGDDVFIGPNASFANDRFPRSRRPPERFAITTIHDGASIGANATILPGVTIGRGAMIGAGAVVTADVPANAKVVGNPGSIIGYVDDDSGDVRPSADRPEAELAVASGERTLPGGAELVELPTHRDMRGALVAGELDAVLPFVPRRYFVVFDVPSRHVRGEHAHRECWQFLTCLAGSVTVHLDDGESRAEVVLDAPGRGLLVPPMVWANQFRYTADAALLVLASHPYRSEDYLRDYEDYLTEKARSL
jgi:acetyltransferase-like isoleucine patch superfamily enzyme/dTDP-4-dehydrorhamnose 3,5-epimerase-like enzyme